MTFLVTFLLPFMVLIFGPAEVFFGNTSEFGFVYGDFAFALMGIAILTAVLMTFILLLLPEKAYQILMAVLFGISLAGYLQVMMLNSELDLLHSTPDGYSTSKKAALFNLLIWLFVIAVLVFITVLKKEIGKNIVCFGAMFLLGIQLIALISLYVTADKTAFIKNKNNEKKYYLSGEDQYKVSANENIIVIVLDYFSNQYIEPMEAAYPGATDFLHDFTYYNNADCTYFGTFPSLAHMMTGNEVDMSVSINEWCNSIWKNEKTELFYSQLKANNYKANIYSPEAIYLCGENDTEILDGKLSNVVYGAQGTEISYGLLYETMSAMSAFRFAPNILKAPFYSQISDNKYIVTLENNIDQINHIFYKNLKEQKLQTDDSANYYIVQHLGGAHEYRIDENASFKYESSLEETAKGCMVIVEEYLNQLKELGVYDDATIIITSDHGSDVDSQVIYYVKQPGEHHEEMPVTNAPISHQEYLPTIAKAAGLDYTVFGKSIYDFSENEKRERTVFVRGYDNNYPAIDCYTGDKAGASNVYYGYTYTGENAELLKQYDVPPAIVIPMIDSFY